MYNHFYKNDTERAWDYIHRRDEVRRLTSGKPQPKMTFKDFITCDLWVGLAELVIFAGICVVAMSPFIFLWSLAN